MPCHSGRSEENGGNPLTLIKRYIPGGFIAARGVKTWSTVFLLQFCALASALPIHAQPTTARPDVTPPGALKDRETIDLGDGVTMEFVLIQPGSFSMGSERNSYDERPVHKVTIKHPFYLGRYEVTQEQWEKVMGANPSHFRGAKLPVENVSWDDCQLFLVALRNKLGRRVVLPTEAQWEYACRAGTTTVYSCGDDPEVLGEHAWHASNSNLTTHPVGQKKPNPWGLFDIHGNVFEWCADWYADAYPPGDAVDPTGPKSGERRTIRGGAWLYVTDNHRSSDRGFSPPDYRVNEYGLRCVMPVDGDADVSPSETAEVMGAVPSPASVQASVLFAQLKDAIAGGNKLHAESLLAAVEKLVPGDARLASLRGHIATLPELKENLVVDLREGVKMAFVLIRPGTFTMGSNETPLLNEKPARQVTITKPFYLGKFEVTQKQWVTVMGRNQSFFKGSAPLHDASQLPVENVSWQLCQSFLAKLNETLPGYRFRLPTEAEWEYACRAGTAGEHSFGDRNELDAHAWFGGNAGGTTHPVGGKAPNAWGVHDMYGNVWEWCQDSFGLYPENAASDPTGSPSGSGTRVLRGGAWNNTANHVNSTFRHDELPGVLMRYYGFRCVAEIAPTASREQP